jgi:hypothetical protein
MESELGSLLSSTVSDSGGSGDDSAGDAAGFGTEFNADATGDTGDTNDTSALNTSQDTAVQSDADVSTSPTEPNSEPFPGWKLNEDGSYNVVSTELPRIQAALQYNEAVSQIFQTPQEAQESYATSSQMRQMQNDWRYGTPDAIRSVAEFLAGNGHSDPAGKMAFQRSFGQLAGMLPDMLRQQNPAAYNTLVQSFGPRIWQPLYQRAASIAAQYGSDSLEAKAALQQAQGVQWGMTGQYPTELPKVDPQSQAQTAFQQREQAFNQRQEAALRRDVQSFNNQFEGARLSQLDQMITAKLAPIKDRYPEIALKDLISGIRGEVLQTLDSQENLSIEQRQEHDAIVQDFHTTWHRGSPGQGLGPRVQAYQQNFLARAGRVLGPIAQKRINAATQARVNANTSPRNRTNAQQGQGANAGVPRQNSPNGQANGRTNGTNGANGTNGQNGRNGTNGQGQGVSKRDQFDKEWQAAFSSFRR